ncbi:tRNA (adenine(58)-N(1))-methyltransferase non-catalytic subunit trm6 [Euphorbia peplus]|nr:tRNA (adenine(58)-N(1))-methyltransferase non-catalytic subunit trm6 [Euphorbia peplus]
MSQNNTQLDSMQNPRITWENCSVLLDINDGDRMVFARLTPGSTLKIGNNNYSLRPLIGCPFGSLFQMDNGNDGPCLSRIIPSKDGNNAEEKGNCEVVEEVKDNRALVDNNQAQSLSGEAIDEMRRQGAKGDDIIEALIANSATFEKKTVFSQEKYKLKKQKKYAPKVLLRRPFSRSICEAYFKKYPNRIGFLRMDTLSLLLSMANVTANSNILVVDMVGGLVTGAVAERLGGTGYVCSTYVGATPYCIDMVRMFNFNNETCKSIVRAPLTDLCLSQDEISERTCADEGGRNMESHDQSLSISMDEIPQTSEHQSVDIDQTTDVAPKSKIGKAQKAGDKASQEALKSWKEHGFSSLIIAAPEVDAWSLIKDLLPLLSYSAPFAIYHQYLQPLAVCMHNLQLEKMAISLQISEPWLREYQVLPSRSHPAMQMSAFGGYILSGMRICST